MGSIAASIVNIVTIGILIVIANKEGTRYWDPVPYQKGKTRAKQVIIMVTVVLLVGMGGMFWPAIWLP